MAVCNGLFSTLDTAIVMNTIKDRIPFLESTITLNDGIFSLQRTIKKIGARYGITLECICLQ
ncbi:MAG TPA: hypothetical protein VK250_12590 [Nitrososphaeraceae archaeon]|nr:hypothetical protein [Nitrososphaeraceae archaeon]